MLLALAQEVPAQDGDRVDSMITNYRVRTQADVPCKAPGDDSEIVVCARRDADRYRVPFVTAGSAADSVPLRTSDLTKNYGRVECGQGAFMAQCGPGFGATVSVGSDGRVGWVEREPAP